MHSLIICLKCLRNILQIYISIIFYKYKYLNKISTAWIGKNKYIQVTKSIIKSFSFREEITIFLNKKIK